MTESERIHVNVSVAVVTDQNKQVLLTFNDNWGMFTLPMARRRQGRMPGSPRRGLRFVRRRRSGVPVRLVAEAHGPKRVIARASSRPVN